MWHLYWRCSYQSAWLTCLLSAMLIAVGFAMRLLSYCPPTHNSDAHGNWIAATWISNGIPFELNFKLSRLGIIMPAVFMQKLFGESPVVYSFAPLLAFLTVLVTAFLITNKLAGRIPALLTAVAILFFPRFNNSATQLLPGIFQAAYLGLMTLFLVYYFRGRRVGGFMFLAGAGLALAYMCKFTALFVTPGIVLLWFCYRVDKSHVMLFCAGFLLLYAGEHAFYFSKGIPGGRFQHLLHVKNTGGYSPQAHLDEIGLEIPAHTRDRSSSMRIHGPGEFYKFFLRYHPKYASWQWTRTLLLWLLSAVYLFFMAGHRYRVPIAIMGSLLFFNTFAVTRFAPLVLMTSPMNRYLDPYSGLVFVGIAVAAWHLARRLVYGKTSKSENPGRRRILRVIGAALGLLGFVWYLAVPMAKFMHYRALRLINSGRILFGIETVKLMVLTLAVAVVAVAVYLLVRNTRRILDGFRMKTSQWYWRQSTPILSVGAAWMLLWPQLGPNLKTAKWILPKRVTELHQGTHRIQHLDKHVSMVNEAFDTGMLIVSPNLYMAPAAGDLDVIGRQSVRRAFVFYLDRGRLKSRDGLARGVTASFKHDVSVEINGRHYWVFAKYDADKIRELAGKLQSDSKVLYMAPEQWTRAEYVTVLQLHNRTDKFWGVPDKG